MRCNNCGSDKAIGIGGSSVPTESRCPECGYIQTFSKPTPPKDGTTLSPKEISTKNCFNLKELYFWYSAVDVQINYMENNFSYGFERDLQYNEEVKKQRLEKIKASKEYKDLVALKEKLENIKLEITFKQGE